MDNRKLKIYIIIFSIFLIQLYCFFIVLKGPIVGIEILKTKEERWLISNIKENNWGESKNLDELTEIIEIDGSTLSSKNYYSKITINRANTLTVIDEGEVKVLEVNYRGMESQFIKHFIVPFVLLLLITAFSFYLLRYPLTNSKKFLILNLQLTSLGYTCAGSAGRGDFLSNITLSLALFLSIVTLIFYCNEFLKTMNKKIVLFLKVFTVLISFLLILINIVRYFTNEILSIQVTLELIILISLLSLFTLNILMGIKDKVYYVKQLFLIFALGIGPFIFLYGIPILFKYDTFLPADIAAIFLLIIPICLFYLELAERLFSLQYALDRMSVHLKMAIPFSLILALVLIILTKTISLTLFSLYFLVIFIGLIIVLYLKESIEVKSNRYIVTSEYYTLSNFHNFIRESSKFIEVNNFIEYIKNEISLILRVNSESINIFKVDFPKYSDYLQKNNYQIISNNLIYKNKSEYIILLYDNIEESWIATVQATEKPVMLESIKMLELLLYYIQNMIDNLLKVEELVNKLVTLDNANSNRWYGKVWINLTEKERKRLAAEIHDTVLQDLIQISRNLEEIVIKQPDTISVISLREEVLDIIENTRDICENLYPPMIERFGLTHSLDELIKKNKIRFNALIKDDFEQLNLSLHQSTSIYRIIQELLSNAHKHSQAEIIEIKLKLRNSRIYIEYYDDGVGFNPQQDSEIKTLGLLGIRERIRYYEGELDIKKGDPKGVKIRIVMNVGDAFENNDFR